MKSHAYPSHQMILASAGSGKTYALTNRILKLLALGAEPDGIIALTFSRKAAAEFFSQLLYRLASASSDEGEAARLASADLQLPHLRAGDFRLILGRVVSEMHRLTLGTLDSFFVRIAKAFPFELGLGGDFQILDSHLAECEQWAIFQRVFQPRPAEAEAQREFIRAFQQATYGREENRLVKELSSFVDGWHSLYVQAPDAVRWGREESIWPEGMACRRSKVSLAALVEAAQAQAAKNRALFNEAQWKRWEDFFEALLAWQPGVPMSKPVEYLFEKLCEDLPGLRAGSFGIKMITRKVIELPPPFCDILFVLASQIIAGEIEVKLRQTQGIWKILHHYDQLYHTFVRRQGKLSFHDVQLVLAGDFSEHQSAPPQISQQSSADNRLLIDFRLDARYDHWLLDEFQDTSGLQWRILSNLIDEILQDDSGERTFFAVGDTKQSIYEWRGGDPGLFRRMLRHYNQNGGAALIEESSLTHSYRSCPAIIEMVNAVFGGLQNQDELVPAGTMDGWEWSEHQSADPEGLGGAFLLEVPKDGEFEMASGDALVDSTCALLSELRPTERGLSCAVLVSRNKRAQYFADQIRAQTGLEVVSSGEASIAEDNPVCAAMLDLLAAATHPGDQFAWHHVLMTPLGTVIQKAGWDQEKVSRQIRCSIGYGGFAAVLREWTGRLRESLPSLDTFSLSRLDELSACARTFDETGSKNADEFLAFARNWKVKSVAAGSAVQVMTIHASKGLGFDIVILPELHDSTLRRMWNDTAVRREDHGHISWIMQLPVKLIAEADPVLREYVARVQSDGWRQNLAKLYVALTRAKKAQYVLIPQSTNRGEEPSFERILTATLGGNSQSIVLGSIPCERLWMSGDWEWHQKFPPLAKASVPPSPFSAGQGELALPMGPGTTLKRFRPSMADSPVAKRPISLYFSKERNHARMLGTLVHELLCQMGWADGKNIAPALAHARRFPHPLNEEALAHVRRCLETAEIRSLLTEPAEPAVLWRERAFEMVHEGNWVSGTIDRVSLTTDGAGKFTGAMVVDFKTEPVATSIEKAAQSHLGQMKHYKMAVSRLTGLPSESITTALVFTAPAKIFFC